MKYYKTFILIVLILSSCSSCEWLIPDKTGSIFLYNNSNNSLFFCEVKYPDTLITFNKDQLFEIKAKEKKGFHAMHYPPSIEHFRETCPSDTLSVFIFNKDTLEEYSWDYIRENNKYQKIIILSSNELEKMNWIITYP